MSSSLIVNAILAKMGYEPLCDGALIFVRERGTRRADLIKPYEGDMPLLLDALYLQGFKDGFERGAKYPSDDP